MLALRHLARITPEWHPVRVQLRDLSTMSRREAVAYLRERDPRITVAAMARLLRCSKTRVQQLCRELGLPTRTTYAFDPACPVCERRLSAHRSPCTP